MADINQDAQRPAVSTDPAARRIFLGVEPDVQNLIREILREEREVQHLSRRSDIHARIYEHIRRLIK